MSTATYLQCTVNARWCKKKCKIPKVVTGKWLQCYCTKTKLTQNWCLNKYMPSTFSVCTCGDLEPALWILPGFMGWSKIRCFKSQFLQFKKLCALLSHILSHLWTQIWYQTKLCVKTSNILLFEFIKIETIDIIIHPESINSKQIFKTTVKP